MIRVEKLEKGLYFDDAYKLSFRYDPITVSKVKELAQRRYLPEDRAWEIPSYELPNLIDKVGLNNIDAEDALVGALKSKEIEDRRAATEERLRGIKPLIDFDFTTEPLPHQIEAFNFGLQKDKMLIGDEQGLGKTKESIDITVARKHELVKTLIVCGVNSVKYNWEREIKLHSRESSVMIDGKTMDLRVKQIYEWYKSSSYFGIINIESLRKEQIQDALFDGIRYGYIGAVIVDEIHKAKNGSSQQGKALRTLKTPIRLELSGTPMNKAEDLWNILTWLGVENRPFYRFRSTYCVMGGYGGYKVVGHKNLESLNAELNTVMLRRKKDEVLDLPPKIHSTEYVELTKKQQIMYRDIKNGIIADLENILTSVNPLSCTLRLRQLTGGLFTEENPKLERLMDMLSEEIIPNGYKALIFSQWEKITEVYYEALKEYNPAYIVGKVSPEDREAEKERFQNDPECKLAIGTIGAMGTGFTLTKASYVFFIDKAWVSGDNAQAEDRAHRIGTEDTVNVISLVAKGTIDEGIEEYLIENQDLFDRVVDGKGSKHDIRQVLNNLLKI
ncbi:DEAD/DEAH box helicase [Hominenteromicrobium sp.]|uniref:DEAD/DEAH box helicase n=1 Tax=Hominenteromicrobium sp. TaxID=3073581 RepID=UPI003AB1823A